MSKYADLTGSKFNRLTVVDRVYPNKDGRIMWRVVCDCGERRTVTGKGLKAGTTKSCGCLQKERAGYTFRNYNRNRQPTPRETREAEFWSYVDKSSDGCWAWIGCKKRGGYGSFFWMGSVELAHRIAWEIVNGSIANGLFVCHKCDNPNCVNPSHLFLGTHKDNMDDMVAKGRHRTRGPRPVINPAIALAIKNLKGVLRPSEIAQVLGVGKGIVRSVIEGRAWAWV